jgi:predicted ABC-type exoprotein transport system permease subunit
MLETFLIAMIVILIVIGIGYLIVWLVPMPEKFKMAFWCVVAIICLLVLLGAVEGRNYLHMFTT